MKLITVCLLVALLSIATNAENDTVIAGPYKVSFDLGLTKDIYQTAVTEMPSIGSLSYYIIITNDTNALAMGITYHEKELVRPSPEEFELNTRSVLSVSDSSKVQMKNIETHSLQIDNTTGGMASADKYYENGSSTKQYIIQYMPAFDNNNIITIASSYPWEITGKFLNTVHVENIDGSHVSEFGQ